MTITLPRRVEITMLLSQQYDKLLAYRLTSDNCREGERHGTARHGTARSGAARRGTTRASGRGRGRGRTDFTLSSVLLHRPL